MLRIIHVVNPHAISYPVDPSAEFEPGMIAQIKVYGNDIFAGVSDGKAPFGIIDDVRTSSFRKAVTDEVVEVELEASNIAVDLNGQRVNLNEVRVELDNPLIVKNSFISDIDVELNLKNGIVTIPAGTPLNYDLDGDGQFDGYVFTVSYMHEVASMPGDDSTVGTGQITIHYQRGFYETDQYDTRQAYPLNATLYVGLDGRLTTKQLADCPGIAMVVGPPSSTNSTLQFLWF